MPSNKNIETFLDKYFYTLSEKERLEFESRGYNIWGVGTDEATSEILVNAIMRGRKRANSSLYGKKDKIPAVGSYGIVLDYLETPKCLVRYTKFDVKPFIEVGLSFAEAEDAQDIEEWREQHRTLFRAVNPKFSEDAPVLCQTFNLVFKD